MTRYGGIEAGGTKFVCAIAEGPDAILDEIRFPTTTPDATIAQAVEFFTRRHAQAPLAAVGIASFGPVDPNPGSSTWGYITTTPKPGWHNTDLAGPLAKALDLPIGFDTDVNGAALGEHRWGAGEGFDNVVYLTVGTGLGGGAVVNGKLLHGMMHPEMGHMLLPRDPARDPYSGHCPYHGDCFEGLVCGPAIIDRWQQDSHALPPDHEAWKLEAHYLALGLVNIITVLSPERIILGGGIMDQSQLFPLVRANVQELLNGYIQTPQILEQIDEYIVAPGLGNQAGVLGAIALAQDAAAA